MAAKAAGLLALLGAVALSSTCLAGGGRVVLPGVDRYRVMDPMFECVRVVLASRGETYSPDYLQGISGSAFRMSGPCPCAPTCGCAMDPMDLLRMLGYRCERTRLELAADPVKDAGPILARVKDEIRAGRPVPVWHAFTTAEWDVVAGFDEDKHQLLGRGSYRGLDDYAVEDEMRFAHCDVCPPFGAMFIGEKIGRFHAREAELSALESAVRHAHSRADRLLAELPGRDLPWRFRPGLSCYDFWANSFRAAPTKVPGAGDRYCLGVWRSTHRAAADFLREIAPKYPSASDHLLRAAGSFAAEADALDELNDKLFHGWEGWQKPDTALAAHAADLLADARCHYAGGIAQIEQALATIDPHRAARATHPALVLRGKGEARIEGVRPLKWGDNRDTTFAGALEAALSVTENPYSYAELMGLSGMAFRLRWSNADTNTKWCHSSAVGEMPDEYHALFTLTGWTLPSEWIEPDGRDNAAVAKRIVASIDAGQPVVCYPGNYNVGLIYGYRDAGATVLAYDYMSPDPIALPTEKLGPLFTYLGDFTKPPSLREALTSSLRMAVANWRREKGDGGLPDREYWYGEAAFAAWIRDLGRFDALTPDDRASLFSLDPWVFTSLIDARRAAATFLREWSIVLDGEPREAMRRAAGLYEDEARALSAFLPERKPIAKLEDWTEESRRKEMDVLTQARGLEASAIAELAKSTIGSP